MPTKELLALVGKATPGPWRDAGAGREKHMLYADVGGVPKPVADVGWSVLHSEDYANAALIVAAVNALPALCAEVEALRKDAERYRWMREKGLSFTHDAEHRGVSTMRWGNWDYDTPEGFAARIDAAIDAAKEPK